MVDLGGNGTSVGGSEGGSPSAGGAGAAGAGANVTSELSDLMTSIGMTGLVSE